MTSFVTAVCQIIGFSITAMCQNEGFFHCSLLNGDKILLIAGKIAGNVADKTAGNVADKTAGSISGKNAAGAGSFAVTVEKYKLRYGCGGRSMKILVIGKEGRLAHYTEDQSLLKKYEISYVPAGASEEEILAKGIDADFILVDAISAVSAELIRQMTNLKMIHSEGVAYNKIDTRAAKERGIYVCNCKGMNAGAVAEQAILLMLGLLRGVATGDAAFREGRQIRVKEAYMLEGSLKELRDCTIGLVGFGDIAKETALLAKAFGCRVRYFNRTRRSPEVEAQYGVSYRELDSLLAESDIVSLHLAVTPETRGIAGKEFFYKMREGAYLINTARGELVDSAALLDAIRSGHLAGAGLDTVTGEPIGSDNIILQADDEVEKKILYSCHVGGITASSFRRGYQMFWSDLEKAAAGERPEHVVNDL